MKKIFELANAKSMPIIDFGLDGLIENIKKTYKIVDESYLGYLMRDVADIADVIIRDAVGDKLSKYGIEEVGCYCVKGDEWIMELKINEDRCALNGLYYWDSFVSNPLCEKYVKDMEDTTIFDTTKYVAMAMIVEGIITEDLESTINDTILEEVEKKIQISELLTSKEM